MGIKHTWEKGHRVITVDGWQGIAAFAAILLLGVLIGTVFN